MSESGVHFQLSGCVCAKVRRLRFRNIRRISLGSFDSLDSSLAKAWNRRWSDAKRAVRRIERPVRDRQKEDSERKRNKEREKRNIEVSKKKRRRGGGGRRRRRLRWGGRKGEAGRFSMVKSRSARGRSTVADEPRLCKVPWRAARAALQRNRQTAYWLLRPSRRPGLKPRYQESA